MTFILSFICILFHMTFVINAEYFATTMHPYRMPRFDSSGNHVHNYELLSSVSLSECIIKCSISRKTNCLSFFYHFTNRFCKIGGEIDVKNAATDSGWKFYGK